MLLREFGVSRFPDSSGAIESSCTEFLGEVEAEAGRRRTTDMPGVKGILGEALLELQVGKETKSREGEPGGRL